MKNADDVQARSGQIQRREFLRRLAAVAVGLPAAGALLGGCGGGGEAGVPNVGGSTGGSSPDTLALTELRSRIGYQVELMMDETSPSAADVTQYVENMNDIFAESWDDLASVTTAQLQASVAPQFQSVLDELDITVTIPNEPPQLTPARLETAWQRADQMLGDAPLTDRARGEWAHLLMTALLLPGRTSAQVRQIAEAAVVECTSGRAAVLYEALHPEEPVQWRSSLVQAWVSGVMSVAQYQYVGMGRAASEDIGLLIGPMYAASLVVLSAMQNLQVA